MEVQQQGSEQEKDMQTDIKCHPIRQEVLHRENWLSLERAHYQTPKGERSWEMVRRIERTSHSTDGVTVIATLKRLFHYDCIILVKQYRPPLQKYTIEFPSGLIDVGENISEAALRELQEETGFTGTLQRVSAGVALDPGTSASMVNIVYVNVDGDEPVNSNPKQQLDENEYIDVLVVPIQKLELQLEEWSQQEDIVIDAKVYVYASCQPKKQRSLNQVENMSRKLGE